MRDMCKKIHVTKSDSGGWAIRNGLKSKPTKVFRAKSDAVRAAKKSGHTGGFIVIHNADGDVSEVRRYKPEKREGKVRIQSAPVRGRIAKKDVFRSIASVEMKSAAR
jgi:hypothetical protein